MLPPYKYELCKICNPRNTIQLCLHINLLNYHSFWTNKSLTRLLSRFRLTFIMFLHTLTYKYHKNCYICPYYFYQFNQFRPSVKSFQPLRQLQYTSNTILSLSSSNPKVPRPKASLGAPTAVQVRATSFTVCQYTITVTDH